MTAPAKLALMNLGLLLLIATGVGCTYFRFGREENCPYSRPAVPTDRSEPNVDHVASALAYLRAEMDTYHARTVVYDDHESGGARFASSGWMKGPDSEDWNAADEKLKMSHAPEYARSGSTGLRIRWTPETDDEWMGVYWQHPEDNWGEYPGLNLTGARNLTFWARGERGNEAVEFCFAGIDCTRADGDQPNQKPVCSFIDSAEKITGGTIILTRDWKQYTIDLQGRDLSSVIGGFCWIASALPNPSGCVFYLDDIDIQHQRLHEPRLIRSYRIGTRPLEYLDRSAPRSLRNTSYVYDNCLAINAFLASGAPGDMDRARLIADAFVRLARHSETGRDRRIRRAGTFLRNAYSCGDLFGWPGNRQLTSENPSDHVRSRQRIPRMPGREETLSGDTAAEQNVKWLEDAYSNGLDTGNMAWAILSLLNVWHADGSQADSEYLDTAEKLARWIIRHVDISTNRKHYPGLVNPVELNAFAGGFEWQQKADGGWDYVRSQWISTEHNIDLAVAFFRLARAVSAFGRADDAAQYSTASDKAQEFIRWASDTGDQYIATGTIPGTQQRSHGVRPLDPQTWSYLALCESPIPISEKTSKRLIEALEWSTRNCQADYDGEKRTALFTYSTIARGEPGAPTVEEFGDHHRHVWPEGTAQVSLALQHYAANYSLSEQSRFAVTPDEIETSMEAILRSHNSASFEGGVPAAYPQVVDQGFPKGAGSNRRMVSYYSIPHIGATAWYVMAQAAWNPFWGNSVAEGNRGLSHEY